MILRRVFGRLEYKGMVRGLLLECWNILMEQDADTYRRLGCWLGQFGASKERAIRGVEHVLSSLEQALARFDLPDLDAERDFWRRSYQEALELMGLPADLLEVVLERWPYARFLRPTQEAPQLLAMKREGLVLGVLTNAPPSLPGVLGSLGLLELTGACYTSSQLGIGKSDPLAFELALQGLGLVPEETLYVDRDAERAEVAEAAGLQVCLVEREDDLVACILCAARGYR